jgi:hypothetical protein
MREMKNVPGLVKHERESFSGVFDLTFEIY